MSYTVEDVDEFFENGFTYKDTYRHWETGEIVEYEVELDWDVVMNEPSDDPVDTPLGALRTEKTYGGEGQGDEYWVVVSFTDSEGNVRYFQRAGWYQSFHGGELEGPTTEVTPKEKVITVYE